MTYFIQTKQLPCWQRMSNEMQWLHFYFITLIGIQLLIASIFLSLLPDLLMVSGKWKHWNLWLGNCAAGLRTAVSEPVTVSPPPFFSNSIYRRGVCDLTLERPSLSPQWFQSFPVWLSQRLTALLLFSYLSCFALRQDSQVHPQIWLKIVSASLFSLCSPLSASGTLLGKQMS